MTPDEIAGLLEESQTAVLATMGADGWPHLSAMWFLPRQGIVAMWTYAKSQKVLNLKRDPRCSLLVEGGEEYSTLRGVLVRAKATLVYDVTEVEAIGRDLYERYTLDATGIPYEEGPHIEVRRQATKRVGLEISLDRVASWDHSKL